MTSCKTPGGQCSTEAGFVEVLFFDFRPAVVILSLLHTHHSHDSCATDLTTLRIVAFCVVKFWVSSLAPRLADRGVGKLRSVHHTINAYAVRL